MFQNIAVIGGTGAIGGAFCPLLAAAYPSAHIHIFSRTPADDFSANTRHHKLPDTSEQAIASAAQHAAQHGPLDLVLVATGTLHSTNTMPEKSLKDLSAEKFQHLFNINTIFPALIAKHFMPLLTQKKRSIFAAISARVGSISDNHAGGWYAYRASKAALNMVIKNVAIEAQRRHKNAIVVGLHPGTVDSALSKPFQQNLPLLQASFLLAQKMGERLAKRYILL